MREKQAVQFLRLKGSDLTAPGRSARLRVSPKARAVVLLDAAYGVCQWRRLLLKLCDNLVQRQVGDQRTSIGLAGKAEKAIALSEPEAVGYFPGATLSEIVREQTVGRHGHSVWWLLTDDCPAQDDITETRCRAGVTPALLDRLADLNASLCGWQLRAYPKTSLPSLPVPYFPGFSKFSGRFWDRL